MVRGGEGKEAKGRGKMGKKGKEEEVRGGKKQTRLKKTEHVTPSLRQISGHASKKNNKKNKTKRPESLAGEGGAAGRMGTLGTPSKTGLHG